MQTQLCTLWSSQVGAGPQGFAFLIHTLAIRHRDPQPAPHCTRGPKSGDILEAAGPQLLWARPWVGRQADFLQHHFTGAAVKESLQMGETPGAGPQEAWANVLGF